MKKLLYVGMLAIAVSCLLASCAAANEEMAEMPMNEKKEVTCPFASAFGGASCGELAFARCHAPEQPLRGLDTRGALYRNGSSQRGAFHA